MLVGDSFGDIFFSNLDPSCSKLGIVSKACNEPFKSSNIFLGIWKLI